MKTKHIALLFIFALCLVLNFSCKKEFKPVAPTTIAVGPSITIQGLRQLYAGVNLKFTSNTSLYGVVTMDETSGSIYKQVYIRDNSGTSTTNGYGAISLHLTSSGGLYQGDSIMVNLNGSTLDISGGGSLQIDSVNVIKQVAKLKTGLNPLPIDVTIPQMSSAFDAHLIRLKHVEFTEIGQTYAIPQAPPAAPQNVNRQLHHALSDIGITAYNSGFSNFAGKVIPDSNGTIVCVANLYNTMQITLRSFQDIVWDTLASHFLVDTMNQSFDLSLTNKKPTMPPGWSNLALQGSKTWLGSQYGISPYVHVSPSASSYGSTDAFNDMWLITPPIKFTPGNQKYMNFQSSVSYPNSTGAIQVSVLVSTSFDGVNLDSTQWTDISSYYPYITHAAFQNFYWSTINSYSATVPTLPGFTLSGIGGRFYIAFRYKGNTTGLLNSTCLIRNVIVRNHP